MSGLFSHAVSEPAGGGDAGDLAAAVTVPADAAHAFAGFTEHVHLWWPAAELSVWGPGSFFDLEDNVFVETSADDQEAVWAEVSGRIHNSALHLVWRHRPGTLPATSVSLAFIEEDSATPRTRVELVHGGWTRGGELGELRSRYQTFWPAALGKYARFMGGAL